MYRYKVKVRGSMFLWGSAGIKKNATFPTPLILHIRNDEHGEPVTFGTISVDGTKDTIGTLGAGEAFSMPILDITGVFATCALDSSVSCVVAAPRS